MCQTDTCDWCGRETNRIQINPGAGVSLCPNCCPEVNPEEMPENAPPEWHFMDENEQRDWKNGMSMEDIREKHEWLQPPDLRTGT